MIHGLVESAGDLIAFSCQPPLVGAHRWYPALKYRYLALSLHHGL
jgi:hypothetical protein